MLEVLYRFPIFLIGRGRLVESFHNFNAFHVLNHYIVHVLIGFHIDLVGFIVAAQHHSIWNKRQRDGNQRCQRQTEINHTEISEYRYRQYQRPGALWNHMSQGDFNILNLIYHNILYATSVDSLGHSKRSLHQFLGDPLSHQLQNGICRNVGKRSGDGMKQNLAEKTDRANNGPVKDRLRRGGLVKKQANNTVSGNIRDDAPCNRQ